MYAYFNYVHIIYILIPFILTIVFYVTFKDKSKTAQKILLILLWCFSMSIMITDLVRGYINYGGWKGVLRTLPLFACDLNNFILPIVLFSKKRHPVVEKYVAYFALTGPIFTMVSAPVANYTHYFYEYAVWSSYLGHGAYVTISLLYLVFNKVKLSSRKPWQMWCMIHGLMLGVHCINLLLIYTGLNPEANYFFTITGFPLFAAWRAMVSLGYDIPYVYAFIFMLVGYTAMTIFFYFVHKIVETEMFAKFVAWLKGKWSILIERVKSVFVKNKAEAVAAADDPTEPETVLPENSDEETKNE